MKLLVKLAFALCGYGLWQWWQYRARQRLREFDAGRRCVQCEGTDVSVQGDVVHCNACNYSDSLSAIARAKLSDKEIADMTHRK